MGTIAHNPIEYNHVLRRLTHPYDIDDGGMIGGDRRAFDPVEDTERKRRISLFVALRDRIAMRENNAGFAGLTHKPAQEHQGISSLSWEPGVFCCHVW